MSYLVTKDGAYTTLTRGAWAAIRAALDGDASQREAALRALDECALPGWFEECETELAVANGA